MYELTAARGRISLQNQLQHVHKSDSHVSYRAGIAIPHRPSRNSGQFLHSYSKDVCIPLAHRHTEPPQGVANKHIPLDIAAATSNVGQMAEVCHGWPPQPTTFAL